VQLSLLERYTPLEAQVQAIREAFGFWNIFLFLGKQRSCDGGGGAQRPVLHVNEPKKTGARSARARTRGQNPLVLNIKNMELTTYLPFVFCSYGS
jgi:hypothetical protein